MLPSASHISVNLKHSHKQDVKNLISYLDLCCPMLRLQFFSLLSLFLPLLISLFPSRVRAAGVESDQADV